MSELTKQSGTHRVVLPSAPERGIGLGAEVDAQSWSYIVAVPPRSPYSSNAEPWTYHVHGCPHDHPHTALAQAELCAQDVIARERAKALGVAAGA